MRRKCAGKCWEMVEVRREMTEVRSGNAGENRESPTQFKLSESNSSESKLIEDEGETQPPPNVVPFPAARADADDEIDTNNAETEVLEATKQVATILNLPVTDGLARVVADYLEDPSTLAARRSRCSAGVD